MTVFYEKLSIAFSSRAPFDGLRWLIGRAVCLTLNDFPATEIVAAPLCLLCPQPNTHAFVPHCLPQYHEQNLHSSPTTWSQSRMRSWARPRCSTAFATERGSNGWSSLAKSYLALRYKLVVRDRRACTSFSDWANLFSIFYAHYRLKFHFHRYAAASQLCQPCSRSLRCSCASG